MIIKQQHPWDCTVACLAMYMGWTYREAFEALGEPKEGVPISDTCETLWALDIDVEWYAATMPTKKALVVVDSKNQFPKRHMIFFDGTSVFDPSGGLTYANVEEMRAGLVGIIQAT